MTKPSPWTAGDSAAHERDEKLLIILNEVSDLLHRNRLNNAQALQLIAAYLAAMIDRAPPHVRDEARTTILDYFAQTI
jgi:hypothetical protein